MNYVACDRFADGGCVPPSIYPEFARRRDASKAGDKAFAERSTYSLHAEARAVAATVEDMDKRQFSINSIVECAERFYPADVFEGVRELVRACGRSAPLYDRTPMWKTLSEQYAWMAPA